MKSTTYADGEALRRLLDDANAELAMLCDQSPGVVRCRELVAEAIKLARGLAGVNPAAALGAKGGKKTAKRGPEYYAAISSMRNNRAGGRPRRVG